jgi:hypothetical protein
MTGIRARITNTVFSNRGSIANAKAAVREGESRASDRISADRALAGAAHRSAEAKRRV